MSLDHLNLTVKGSAPKFSKRTILACRNYFPGGFCSFQAFSITENVSPSRANPTLFQGFALNQSAIASLMARVISTFTRWVR
jgi:hypothetical protein